MPGRHWAYTLQGWRHFLCALAWLPEQLKQLHAGLRDSGDGASGVVVMLPPGPHRRVLPASCQLPGAQGVP